MFDQLYFKPFKTYRRIWPHQNCKVCKMVAFTNCSFDIPFYQYTSLFTPFALLNSQSEDILILFLIKDYCDILLIYLLAQRIRETNI